MNSTECKNHGAQPVEYMKKGSEFRSWFCGGIDGCGKDVEVEDPLVLSAMFTKSNRSECEKLEFGCYVLASLYDLEHFRVLGQASICKKGHKRRETCGNHDCDDLEDALELFHDDDDGFYSITLPYKQIHQVMCPPDCDHRKK